jgi:hypothetical protein
MEIYLRTVFNYRKPLTPRIDPATVKHAAPSPPVPLTATWGVASWIWGGAPMTGVQFDALSECHSLCQGYLSNMVLYSCWPKSRSNSKTARVRQTAQAAHYLGSRSGKEGACL